MQAHLYVNIQTTCSPCLGYTIMPIICGICKNLSLGGQRTWILYGRPSCPSNKDYFYGGALLAHCWLELLCYGGRLLLLQPHADDVMHLQRLYHIYYGFVTAPGSWLKRSLGFCALASQTPSLENFFGFLADVQVPGGVRLPSCTWKLLTTFMC